MRRTRLRLSAGIAALAFVGAACSGAPRPASDDVVVDEGNVAAEDPGGGSDTSAVAPSDDGGTTASTEDGQAGTTASSDDAQPGSAGGEADGGEADVGSQTAGESGGTSGQSGTTTSDGSDTSTSGGTGSGTTGDDDEAPDDGDGSDVPSANVYSPEDAVVGITDDEIYICGHAALIFAEAFDVRPEDLNVYFEMVNQEQGGVYGRKVRIDWEDDAYSPDQAITAAQTCVDRNPFMLIGGIGFDQIPGVRANVESKWHLPYIHHIAVEPETNPTYSFSFLPTVERMGRGFGEYIAANHGDQPVGIISRDSENWGPGHDAALAELEARGVEVVADHETAKDQHAYQQELFDLQSKGAEVVWVWESALASAEIIQQANQQQYYPTWVVFPFQLTLDTATPQSDVEGVAAWPSYAPGGYEGSDPVGHNDDIALFEAAYEKYRPDTDPNDLLYITWSGHKALHQLLLDCGPNCDRNKIHGLIEAGYQRGPSTHDIWQPNCAVDFSRPDTFGHHYGGFRFYAQSAFEHSSGQVFGTDQYCWERFG